ncbi:MAG: hypothetical protein L0170_03825, partial [Acidobacteria bacterium]|nr:hypothetical protein [Acidobacteriota bacterium]
MKEHRAVALAEPGLVALEAAEALAAGEASAVGIREDSQVVLLHPLERETEATSPAQEVPQQ